jgi:hypothetical protein
MAYVNILTGSSHCESFVNHPIGHLFIFGCIPVGILIIIFNSSLVPQEYAQFFEQNPEISYYNEKGMDGDHVPSSMLYAICYPISIGISLGYYFSLDSTSMDSKIRFVAVFTVLMGLFCGVVTSLVATDILKRAVGRTRPMALYGCNYAGYRYL